ncbi:MAG: polyphosphate kinase 1, partial [Saprospiraceae bacterium]
SSADWMVRNLSYRIETIFPVYDPKLKKMINDLLKIQLNDNVKARILDENHSNFYKQDNNDVAIRSQMETYYYLKRQEEYRE